MTDIPDTSGIYEFGIFKSPYASKLTIYVGKASSLR